MIPDANNISASRVNRLDASAAIMVAGGIG
jgi:hypothetical protein